MRKAILLAVILTLSTLLVGCGMAAPGISEGFVVERGEAAAPEVAPAPPPASEMVEEQAPLHVGAQDAVSDRMIVRTAELSLVVENTEEALADIESMATALEGYISDLRTWREDEQLAATVTVRVPAASFDEARERIKGLAVELEAENVSGQDVTEEYVDLEARLRNLETAETELLELLASAQETHRDAESILAIYRELTSIRQQIEQIQGRMQYLESASSLATLTISLTPEQIEEPVVEPGWEPLRQVRDALRALISSLKFLADVLIWVVVFFLPLLAILAVPFVLIWLGWFLWRRRRKRSKDS